jgi:hypothetical protein
MVTQAIPSQQMVTGSEIANLGAMLAQMAAQTQLGFQDQAGYYNPALFGSMAGFQPTLARDQLNLQGELGRGNLALGQGNLQLGRDQLGLDRELGFGQLGLGRDQLNAAIAEAQRNYQLDLQRFGLEVANVNYQQRLGEATVRLEQLGLLSSLRGPSDYLAHNYVMNNMSAPEGQAADPFKMTAGLNQQYTPPPMPNIPQPPPTTMYNNQMKAQPSSGTGVGTGTSGSTYKPPTNAMAPKPKAVAPPSPSGLAISGNSQADAQLKASSAWAGAPPAIQAEFDRISANMANTYANAKAKNPNFQLFAEGGNSPGGMAIVGDDPSGQYTGNEELVMSEGPFEVLDHQDTVESGALPAAGIEGAPAGGQNITQMIIEAFKLGQQESGMPPMDTPPPPMPEIPTAHQGGQFPGMGNMGNRGGWGGGFGGGNWQQMMNQGGGSQVTQQGQQNSYNQSTPSIQPMPNMPQMPPYAQSIMDWVGQRPDMSGGMGALGGMRSWLQNIPRAATGGSFTGANGTGDGQGFFNFQTYNDGATQNAPFVQQTLGNMESPAFQQRGQDLGPFGAQPFSYTNYLSMLPSAREMLKGYVETPTPMGGLGADWMDELERSRRAAATGASLGPAQYSR